MIVENTFGHWKGRFYRFGKHVDMEVTSLIDVLASCILHNICEIWKNDFLPIWEEPKAVEDQAEAFDDIDATDAQCFD